MPVVMGIVLCFLASVGVVQVIGWLIFCLWPVPRCESIEVIPLCPDPEELEAQLRHQLFLLRWSAFPRPCRAVLLDTGLGEEAREICRNLLGDSPAFLLCTPKELAALLERPSQEEALREE